jgi:hypothetical protein
MKRVATCKIKLELNSCWDSRIPSGLVRRTYCWRTMPLDALSEPAKSVAKALEEDALS